MDFDIRTIFVDPFPHEGLVGSRQLVEIAKQEVLGARPAKTAEGGKVPR